MSARNAIAILVVVAIIAVLMTHLIFTIVDTDPADGSFACGNTATVTVESSGFFQSAVIEIENKSVRSVSLLHEGKLEDTYKVLEGVERVKINYGHEDQLLIHDGSGSLMASCKL